MTRMKNPPRHMPVLGFLAAAAAFLLAAACATKPAIIAPPVGQPAAAVRPSRVFAPESVRKALNELMKEPYSDTRTAHGT